MIGEIIGNFRLVKRLGSGGMGEVYLAEHKDLQTPVAVKLLNRDISDNHDHVQRFFNEARVVSKIKSAGTVKIFDSGFFKEQAYLIMELLEGESLASRISKRGSLPGPQVLDIARQIASVLDATHRQGVTHRDLKPDNIYIVHDDERATGERVKILDFGIAKLSGTLAVASPKTSGTMGTPAYMAPEQWGDSSQVDWRADAYSLGCVMFEMTCGRPPFQPTNIAEAFMMHATRPPPSPGSLVSGVSTELEALILRLLSKEPADRCVSMGQITRELADLMGDPRPISQPSIAVSQPAIDVPPTQPPIAPTVAVEERVTHPSSHPIAMPNTTLGGSAAALEEVTEPPKKKSFALIAGLGMAAVAAVIVAVVMVGGKDSTQPAAAPTTETVETPTPTTPPPPVAAPPAATPPEVTEKPAPPPSELPSVQEKATTPTPIAPVDQRKERRKQRREAAGAAANESTTPKTTATTETKPAETKPAAEEPAQQGVQQLGGPNQNTGRKRFGGSRL